MKFLKIVKEKNMIKLYNTLTKQKEILETIEENKVKDYDPERPCQEKN